MKNKPTVALIVAAGSSSRYGEDVPKPYINLMGRPVLAHVLEVFTRHPRIDAVRVVINRAHHPLYKKAAAGFSLFPPVIGGERRQDSVRIGLEAIARANPGYVLIHDAARPMVDAALIDRVLDGLENSSAVLPCLPVTDSIHQHTQNTPPLAGGLGGRPSLIPVDRSQLVAAQTPQAFHFDAIFQAHQQYQTEDVTDDIALAERANLPISLVEGSPRNIKLTTPDQFAMLEYMMSKPNVTPSTNPANTSPTPLAGGAGGGLLPQPIDPPEIRVGQGYDVHAFEPHPSGTSEAEKLLSLCGLRIPHTHKLKGHSDADVGLHAITDAILGAIAEGDLGQHFPDTDVKWKGADSRVFLEHAHQLVKDKGGEITNIDLTIIGEQPKIAPHREAMRQQVAMYLQLDVRRVNIKATTTEKLGFLGRSEGLAAQAIATIKGFI